MTTTTHRAGEHVATLHGPSGAGILSVPAYDEIDHIGGKSGDWNAIMRDLCRIGWAPLTDEWDLPLSIARLSNGGTVFALQADDSHARASDADYDLAMLTLLASAEG